MKMSIGAKNEMLYCPNCGHLIQGYKADSGKMNYLCPICGGKSILQHQTRRSLLIEMFAPNDSTMYGVEHDYIIQDPKDFLIL